MSSISTCPLSPRITFTGWAGPDAPKPPEKPTRWSRQKKKAISVRSSECWGADFPASRCRTSTTAPRTLRWKCRAASGSQRSALGGQPNGRGRLNHEAQGDRDDHGKNSRKLELEEPRHFHDEASILNVRNSAAEGGAAVAVDDEQF